jgi:pyridoxal/pyridoxine/pyridoxamine kinase
VLSDILSTAVFVEIFRSVTLNCVNETALCVSVSVCDPVMGDNGKLVRIINWFEK